MIYPKTKWLLNMYKMLGTQAWPPVIPPPPIQEKCTFELCCDLDLRLPRSLLLTEAVKKLKEVRRVLMFFGSEFGVQRCPAHGETCSMDCLVGAPSKDRT